MDYLNWESQHEQVIASKLAHGVDNARSRELRDLRANLEHIMEIAESQPVSEAGVWRIVFLNRRLEDLREEI